MRVLLIILGVVAALLTLFVGGCSLLFGISFLFEEHGQYDFWVIPATGLAIAPVLGWVAWLLLRAAWRRPPAQ